MCELLIYPEIFNPKVFYICKKKILTQASYPKHDYIEIKYIFSGEGKYIIDGITYNVKSGDIIILNPGIELKTTLISNKTIVEFQAGFTDIHIKNYHNILCPYDTSPVIYMVSNHRQEFVKCCYEILEEQQNKKHFYDLTIKALFMKLLVLVIRELYPIEEKNQHIEYDFEFSNKTYIVNTIISYLNENYFEKISLSKISQNIYLSPIYISKLFKEETGESPINYLIQVRLKKAKEILSTSKQLSIKDIAKTVGYEDVYYFSKLFKKYYGFSPTNYYERFISNK